MNLWNPFRRKEAVAMSDPKFAALLAAVFGGAPSKSGATVTAETALQVSTVFAVTRALSNGIAQVPLKLYRTQGRDRKPATDHPLYMRLHRKPNPWMSSFELRETMAIHVVLKGNAYAFLNRTGRKDEISEIIPLTGAVKVVQASDFSLSYQVQGRDGSWRTFPSRSIWHWRGPSLNGYLGLEAVRYAREAIGLAMATEESQAKAHARGLKVSGVYSVEDKLNQQQYQDLRTWIEAEYGGSDNASRMMLLDRGAKFTPTAMTSVDAQHLETRRFQVEEICRQMGVLPVVIGYSDKTATFASVEAMFLAHLVHSLAPWYERIEQSANVQLLSDDELADGYYVKHTAAGLLRGSMKDTAEYLTKLVLNGIMTRNEARDVLEFNPLDGLDEPLTPANMNTGAGKDDQPDDGTGGGTDNPDDPPLDDPKEPQA